MVSDGIQVNAGCSDIKMNDIIVKSALRGISLDCVTNSLIRNCDMNLNTTGIELDDCHNVFVGNCTAQANVQAGYCLLTSTTCSFLDCKALSTGQGNSNSSGNESFVYGFVSRDGFGNIFERCVTNSTQNLNATDYDTTIAGFALLGTGTQCHKIVACEAGNATTSPHGFTVPYGIFIEGSLESLTSVTAQNNAGADAVVQTVWSPDGKYFAATKEGNIEFFEFDRESSSATNFQSVLGVDSILVYSLDWSPSGKFIAAGGTGSNTLSLYKFDAVNQQAVFITSFDHGADVLGTNWSFDERFIAIAGGSASNVLRVVEFDPITPAITSVDTTAAQLSSIRDVRWAPDGKHVAIAINSTTQTVRVYSFDRTTKTLGSTPVTLNLARAGFGVDWTPDGKYLGIFRNEGSGTNTLVYEWDGSSLTFVAGADATASAFGKCRWSPDGNYLAAGPRNFTGTRSFNVYRFDRSAAELQLIDTFETTFRSQVLGSPGWSPDGELLTFVGPPTAGQEWMYVVSGIQFPTGNVIQNNKIYCNSGNGSPSGVGISGSSISNMIIGNSAFDNPFNYQFVTNVFNQLFGFGPSILQNISTSSTDPITRPLDVPAKTARIELLLESLIDNLL